MNKLLNFLLFNTRSLPNIRAIHQLVYFIVVIGVLVFSANLYANDRLEVIIEGIDKELLSNVKNTLSILREEKETPEQQLTDSLVKRSYSQASEQIKQALRPFGYYQPKIQASLTQKEKQWIARFQVTAGTQTQVRDISININGPGNSEPEIQTLLKEPTIKVGGALNHQAYSNYKQSLYDTLFNKGYIDAQYQKSEMRVDINNNEADIILDLDSGQQYFFGNIDIQQSAIEPEKIAQIVTIDQDTPFNTDRLLQLQLKLSDTGYFASTDISVQREQTANKRIPVTIITTPSKKLKYSTSVGYGTDTGARVGLSVLNRRINKKGHRSQYSMQLSRVESNVAAQYIIPIGNINTEYVDVFANTNQEIANDVDTTQYSIGSSLNQNRWHGRRRFSLTLIQEQFSFDDENNQTANLLIPGLVYNYKKADDALFTRQGYSFAADIHGGIESSISETSFFHSRLRARSVHPLSSNSRLLNLLELGAIITDEFEELPPSERFFTGGSQSVRGYEYKNIGPRNSFDNNIGGKYLLAGSIEVDYLAWGNFGFALFYDFGDANSKSNFSLKTSAGLGFRYRSAIGMVRIDLAHPFDEIDGEDKKDVRLHISIGPDL